MIKAIFFDLDGTLLNSRKVLPKSAIAALKSCREKNIKLFIATARTPDLDKCLGWSAEILSLFDGGVYCNGAVNILYNKAEYNFIDSRVINGIVTIMKSFPHINLSLQSVNNVHAFNNILSKSELSAWGTEEGKMFSTENISYEEILKVLIFDGGFTTELNVLPEKVINILSDVCGKLARIYVTDGNRVIQVGDVEACKYNGVESIRKRLGIAKSEVAVFGDDINDLEMLSGYENSVAMGNAVDEIKSAAGFVTKNNDDDGIAFAVENILRF